MAVQGLICTGLPVLLQEKLISAPMKSGIPYATQIAGMGRDFYVQGF